MKHDWNRRTSSSLHEKKELTREKNIQMGAKNWRKKTKENGEVSEREMGVFWRLWESGSVLGDFCCWLQIEGDFRCCYKEIF